MIPNIPFKNPGDKFFASEVNAIMQGFTSMQGEIDAIDNIELRTTATHIQWKYLNSSTWNDLILLSTLKGDKGDTGDAGTDGKNIELQKSVTHIQWRNVGDVTWNNLVALTEITGPAGQDGVDGKSAYQIALDNGFIGTEVQWLDSLNGVDGDTFLTETATRITTPKPIAEADTDEATYTRLQDFTTGFTKTGRGIEVAETPYNTAHFTFTNG